MLVEFSVENYRSIAEKQTLSMVASSEKNLLDNTFTVTNSDNLKLLKSAVIYGANASGKTNILRGLSVLKELVLNSATRLQVNDKLAVVPFKLNQEWRQKITRFEIIFIQKEVKYEYQLSLDLNRIYEESLLAYPNGRKQTWYSRKFDKHTNEYRWRFSSNLKGAKERIKNFVRPNSLFISHAAQNNHEQLTVVFNWFIGKLLIQEIDNLRNFNFYKTAFLSQVHEEFINLINIFLKTADLGIDGIKIIKKEKSTNPFDIQIKSNSPLKLYILNALKDFIEQNPSSFTNEFETYNIKTLHKINENNQMIEFDLNEESSGTQKIFLILGELIYSLLTNAIFVIDELEASLHPALAKMIAQIFKTQIFIEKILFNENESSQLIFTTHDTTLLDKEIFRRDQIWFTEKNEHGATELYSLVEFEEIENESLQKGYLQGRYGAIPFIGEFQF